MVLFLLLFSLDGLLIVTRIRTLPPKPTAQRQAAQVTRVYVQCVYIYIHKYIFMMALTRIQMALMIVNDNAVTQQRVATNGHRCTRKTG